VIEQVRQLVKEHEAAKRDIDESRRALDEAMKDLEVTRTENQTLSQRVRELVRQFEASQVRAQCHRASAAVAVV
jgi:predicted  nucleic acid-binding Zn-ribbon protein